MIDGLGMIYVLIDRVDGINGSIWRSLEDKILNGFFSLCYLSLSLSL